MRDSLKQSIADTPAAGFERYPKGSIILCNACAKPIFKLDRSITLGAKAGGAASAFKPLALNDLVELEGRVDVDAGLRSLVAGWNIDARKEHVSKLHEMRSGAPMLCPCCNDCFVQVLSVDRHEVLDKAYAIELLSVPPFGVGTPTAIRGKRLGAGPGKDWVHKDSKLVH